MRAYVLLQQSRFEECLAVCDEIERLARDASDPLLLGYALHTRAAVLLRRGHFAPARELYLEAIELYRPVPAPFPACGRSPMRRSAICGWAGSTMRSPPPRRARRSSSGTVSAASNR